jgi:hypothetical protein
MQEFYQAIKHLAQTRVFALIAPSETIFPCIVYTPVATEQVIGINGLHGVVRIRMLGSVMAVIDTVSDVRMVNSGFDEEARIYRITVDYTYLH